MDPASPPQPPPAPVTHPFWTFVQIVNVRLRFIFLMVIVGLVAGSWESIMNRVDRWRRPSVAGESVESKEFEYYCGMHPNIVRAEPGKCPICGMPLTKRARTTHRQELPEGVLAQVQLTPLKVRMGRIETSPVEFRVLKRELRTVGIVDYDETRRAFISARIRARVDKLLVNYVGQKVRKGDPLAEVYAPDLLVAQGELLNSVKAAGESPDAGGPAARAAQSLVESARKKLALWGISEEQVDEIVRRGAATTQMTLFSPMSGIVTEKKVLVGHYVDEGADLYTIADLGKVWLQTKIFEDDLAGIEPGTAVEVTCTAYPSELFAGRITFVAYIVDPATRTVSARVEVDNPDYKLKPGMYAQAVIRLPVGKVTELPAPAANGIAPGAGSVATGDIVRAYLALAAAYAADKTAPEAARQLAEAAQRIVAEAPAAAPLAQQAGALAGKDLEAQREIFKAVSKAVIDLLRLAPANEAKLFIAHCPMANADWVTDSKEIANPFAGSEMTSCGSITGPLEPAPAGVSEDERSITGYYCPVYPEKIYDRPGTCAIDGAPYKYARIEKVLSVPESAVIDSGTRKVAYRESAPGTFDMVEVTLGARAEEFFPVVAGLKAGDRVAARGAFLVDAENRLSPGAAAQFFGASGSPGGDKDAAGGKQR